MVKKKHKLLNRMDETEATGEFLTLDDLARQSNAKTTNYNINQSSIRSPTELGYEDSGVISNSNLGFAFDIENIKM
jgi:hypothetical protein